MIGIPVFVIKILSSCKVEKDMSSNVEEEHKGDLVKLIDEYDGVTLTFEGTPE